MKNTIARYTLIGSLLLLIYSCKQDSIITETITTNNLAIIEGNAYFDQDGDLVADSFMGNALVYYGDSSEIMNIYPRFPDDTFPSVEDVLATYTNEIGEYRFENLPPAEGKVLIIVPPVQVYDLNGTDITPDGDPQEALPGPSISVAITEEEQDDGNNFLARLYNTEISGTVREDVDGNGTGDEPKFGMVVRLYHRLPNGQPQPEPELAYTVTDVNGYYEIPHIIPGEYVLEVMDFAGYVFTSGNDDSPDPDGIGDSNTPRLIPVDLSADESDEDNNFVLEMLLPDPRSINGVILEDINNDLVGDNPVEGLRVELYARNGDGVPTGSLIGESYSDESGFYGFTGVPPGEYVIYYIGSIEYGCVASADLSPEPGEPTGGAECQFIPVDLPDVTSVDTDNTYVVQQ